MMDCFIVKGITNMSLYRRIAMVSYFDENVLTFH